MASESNKESPVPERIFVGIGSNRGQRYKFVKRAVESFSSIGLNVVATSSIYQTEPVGLPANTQPFLNLCVEGRSDESPRELMDNLLELESRLGRQRANSEDDRRIDLDLLLFGQRCLQTSYLQVPHPRMDNRRFVLKPLSDIAPDVRHPTLRCSISELLDELDGGPTVEQSHVKKLSPGSHETPK
jgi:2-amino-4-hydroxy-6-hydroxymethyldihydropteridine diphosphokinase